MQSIEALAFSPHGKRLAAGLSDGLLAWEDLTRPEERVRAEGHLREGCGLAWSLPDGRFLVSGGWDPPLPALGGRRA